MKLILCIAICAVLTACNMAPNANEVEAAKQDQMKAQADNSVGMPAITNFQEKRILKNILELRDQQIKTITYTQDFNAKLHKLCDSVGYGIPYSTQYTNPQVAEGHYADHMYVVAQADPNGLYSPSSASGTWVMCMNPDTKALAPVYVEPNVVVSPFPLPGVVQ